jgi:hypothetical protein
MHASSVVTQVVTGQVQVCPFSVSEHRKSSLCCGLDTVHHVVPRPRRFRATTDEAMTRCPLVYCRNAISPPFVCVLAGPFWCEGTYQM